MTNSQMHGFKPGDPGVHDMGALEPFIHSIPNDVEQYQSIIMLNNISILSDYLNEFCASVALLEHVEMIGGQVSSGVADKLALTRNMHMLRLWREMAGRDAVMTVFHYENTLEAIRSGLRNTPTLANDADNQSLREAARRFRRDFPNADLARHAVGHRGEFATTFDEAKKHAVSGEGRHKFIMPHVEGNEFVATAKKQEVRLRIDNANRENLAEITAQVFSAFPALNGKLPPIHIR